MDKYIGDTIEVIPLKGYSEMLIFQNKHDLEMTVNAYPDKIVSVVGDGKSGSDEDFPNVFIALRKCDGSCHCTAEHRERLDSSN